MIGKSGLSSILVRLVRRIAKSQGGGGKALPATVILNVTEDDFASGEEYGAFLARRCSLESVRGDDDD